MLSNPNTLENDFTTNTLVFAIVISFFIISTCNHFFFTKKSSDSYCPVAPLSYIQAVKGLTSRRSPWFMLDLCTKTCSRVYFVCLPTSTGGIYIVGDVPTMRAILQDPKSDKPRDIYQPFEDAIGRPNLFSRSTEDPILKSTRKCIFKAFSPKDVKRMNVVCDKYVNNWIKNDLEKFIDEKKSFDPSEEMVKLTFDLIMESAFEYPTSNQTKDERSFFLNNLEKVLVEFGSKQPSNPLRAYLTPLIKERRDAIKASKNCKMLVQKVIDYYLANTNKSEENTIIKLVLENKDFKTDEELVAEIFIMMIGGFETTAYSLSSTLILLAKHPRVAKKLRKELFNMDPLEWSKSLFLRCVIQESKRLLPVAATGSGRRTSKDFVVQTPPEKPNITIPKGASIMVPFIVPFRDPVIFKDPETFHPERWAPENVTKQMQDALIPFSLGNRNCVGQTLAVAELYSTIPKLIAKYDFEIDAEGELEYFLTMKYIGCRLRAMKASA